MMASIRRKTIPIAVTSTPTTARNLPLMTESSRRMANIMRNLLLVR
jgi:hypothetical protein